LRYCYESRELLPHFSGNSLFVPKESPGAAIEILQQLDQLTQSVTITYIRAPWKRCLKDLASGEIDGLVGSFSNARAEFGVYPIKNNLPDINKAFSQSSTCLIQLNTANINWRGNPSEKHTSIIIAVSSGYQIISVLHEYGYNTYETTSEEQAYKLLYNKRVDGSISSCINKTLREDIEILQPPLSINYGYLIFSQPFYRDNKEHAESLWDNLKAIDKNEFYGKYQ